MLLPVAIAGGHLPIFAVLSPAAVFSLFFYGRRTARGERFCGFPQPAADNLL
jgi:hypothetical protein